MPIAKLGSVHLNYLVAGTAGPMLALNPGGRRSFAEFLGLADKIARQGFRVLMHDRRNCGESDIVFDSSDAEDALWAEDLHRLLHCLGVERAFIGGSSSGCRMSILYYLRHREAVMGLCLFRVTGGSFAAERLPENYYQRFLDAARAGGMGGVCEIDHWQDRFKFRPQDRDILMKMDVNEFIHVMEFWRGKFVDGVNLPILGVSADELASIRVPTVVIPGNDKIHSAESGALAHALIPGAVLHRLPLADTSRDLVPYEEWADVEDEIADTFVEFMRRVGSDH